MKGRNCMKKLRHDSRRYIKWDYVGERWYESSMRAFYRSETPLSSLQSDIISLYRHRQAHYASSGIWKLWKILGKIFSALKHNKSEKSRKWESLENTLSLCASTQFYRKVSFQQAPDTFHVLIPQDVYYAGIMQNNAIVVIVAVFIFRLLKKLSMIFFAIKQLRFFISGIWVGKSLFLLLCEINIFLANML